MGVWVWREEGCLVIGQMVCTCMCAATELVIAPKKAHVQTIPIMALKAPCEQLQN